MNEAKYVPMVTFICKCGKEFKMPIDVIGHFEFDVASCIPCNHKDGDRISIRECYCKKEKS